MNTRQVCQRFYTVMFCTLLIAGGTAQAGMVDLTLFGETVDASNENAFGLNQGDQVSLKATFDYSLLSGIGSESVNFASGSGNSLSLFLGDLTFTAENHAGFSLGFPSISFIDGAFSGIDYIAFAGESGAQASLFSHDNTWRSIDSGFAKTGPSILSTQWVIGSWDAQTTTVTPTPNIPEPAPLALAALGLLGAWIASRRRTTLT